MLTKNKNNLSAKDIFIFVLMGITGVLITFTGIYYKQDFLRILPLYISLVIAMLQSRVNRYASLMGSINSLLYGVSYIFYGIYASAISAFLFSFPVQMLTFVRWNKNKWKNSTVLRKLNIKQRIIISVGFVVALVVMWVVLPLIGSQYVFLDSVTNLLGILIYFLTMFAFVEYTFLMVINGVIGIALNVEMLGNEPEIASYLIFSVYSFICIVFAFFNAKKLYKSQQSEKI